MTRLEAELEALAPWASGAPLRTIFVGGGTPTLLRVELWERLLERLGALFDLGGIRALGSGLADAGEFTVECNPETATPELMRVLAAGGVTRISVGAQSFDPRHLKALERWHDPDNVARAIELARAAGIERQSVDLIFGVPGQTLADWERDLDRAIELGTEHLSCYGLTYEPNTAMTALLGRGEFVACDEDVEADMFEATLRRLRAAGLDRYEVSNFARAGAECRHNLAYWRQEAWLAAGPSASAHVGGHRWKNVPRLDDYLDFNDRGFAAVADHETPNACRALTERIMTGLRLSEGIDSERTLRDAAGLSAEAPERLARTAQRQINAGLMSATTGRWTLTDAGFLMTNRVVGAMARALDVGAAGG